MKKIFIVEDEKTLRDELTKFLSSCGYTCEASDNYEDMAGEALAASPDIVLLDINLPYLDGYHVCREIRKHSQVPIIVVTSRDTDMDELMSMNLGADDFVGKPYNLPILLARISAVLRRADLGGEDTLQEHRGLKVHVGKSLAEYEGKEVELTRNELRILATLFARKGNIVSREELMDALWQSDEFVDDNTLTVNVNRLRKKLEDIGAAGYIATKRGQGYQI